MKPLSMLSLRLHRKTQSHVSYFQIQQVQLLNQEYYKWKYYVIIRVSEFSLIDLLSFNVKGLEMTCKEHKTIRHGSRYIKSTYN